MFFKEFLSTPAKFTFGNHTHQTLSDIIHHVISGKISRISSVFSGRQKYKFCGYSDFLIDKQTDINTLISCKKKNTTSMQNSKLI